MDKIIHFLTENLYSYMVPICIFCVYRIAVCFMELGRIKTLREKKGVFRSVRSQYTEIGTFTLALVGGILTCLIPKLWFVFILLMFALGFIGFRIGRNKGTETDNIYREVALEMKKMETDELDGHEEHPVLSGAAGLIQDFSIDFEDTTAKDAEDE